jgi:hypothetical protein
VLGVLLAVAVGWNLFHYDGEYLYRGYDRQLEAAEIFRDTPCICIYEGYSFYENLPEFNIYETTLLVKPEELEKRLDTASIQDLEQVVILEKRGIDGAAMEVLLKDKYNLYPAYELIAYSPHGDRIRLWEKRG